MKNFGAKTFLSVLILSSGLIANADSGGNKIPLSLDQRLTATFGSGYNSRTQRIHGVCLDKRKDDGSAPNYDLKSASGYQQLDASKSVSEISDMLGVTAKGRYKAGVTQTSASAEFLNKSESSEFSLSYSFVANQEYALAMMNSRDVPIRVMPNFQSVAKSSQQYYEKCGDEYVESVGYAARLMVNITISFVSKSEMRSFKAQANFKSSVVDIGATIENAQKRFSSGNHLKVSVYQIGGDPTKMGKIFCPGRDEKGEADPECVRNARLTADCSFGEAAKCTQLISNAIAYANATDGDNFPSQLHNRKNFVPTVALTQSNSELADILPRTPSIAEDTYVKDLRENVLRIFEVQHKRRLLAQNLMNGKAPRLSERQRDEMEKLERKHTELYTTAIYAVGICFDKDVKECQEAYSRLYATVGFKEDANVEAKQLKAIVALTEPETFVQYCDLADDDHPAIKTTMNSLKRFANDTEAAKTSAAKNFAIGDACQNYAGWFEGLTELDLSQGQQYPIADLGAIFSLKNLQKLNLSNQSLRSISGVESMQALKELRVDNNLVSDLEPVSKLSRLEVISVQNNRIKAASMATLSRLENVRSLDARGNQEDLQCPLKKVSSCKMKSFQDYANILSSSTACEPIMNHQAVALNDSQILVVGGVSLQENEIRSDYKVTKSSESSKIQVVDHSGCRVMSKGLNVARMGHSLTWTPQGILVVGGKTQKIEMIDPKTFESRILASSLPQELSNHTATRLDDGRVVIVGGELSGSNSGISRDIYVIHPNGSVESIGKLAVPRVHHTATKLQDGRILVLGGYSSSAMLDIAEMIDPVQWSVTVLKDVLPTGRSFHSAVLLGNGHVLVVGGRTYDDSQPKRYGRTIGGAAEIVDFDPQTQKFRVIDEKLNRARYNIQAVKTSDGRVLLFGGLVGIAEANEDFNGYPAMNLIQVYDPESEGIYEVGTMLDSRIGFTATALPRDGVLIFGGLPSTSYGEMFWGGILWKTLKTSTELLVYRPR